MMRFSVIRTLASVVVAFMVLGYPVIGQAKKCGESINPINNQTVSKVVCVTMGSPDSEMRSALKMAKPSNFNTPKCTQQCTEIDVCPSKKPFCVPVEEHKNITYGQISCQVTPAKPDEEQCKDTENRYVCTMNNITQVICPCSCCKNQFGGKFKAQEGEQCNPETEDCGCGPDLVDLDEFTATPQNEGISLTWTTKSELDSQGFRIWRGTPDLGKYCGCSDNMDDYKQITITTLDEAGNPTLIPATGSTTSGSNYSYLDKDVKPGIPYCYALEDIDSKGESKFYFEYISFTPDAELEKGTP